MENTMASSEALSIVQFARLSRGNDDDRDRVFPANAKRPHPTGAMPLCAPPSSVYDESRDVVAGIAFRAVGGSDVEALWVEPPVMTSSGNDADGHEEEERVGANRCVDGGGFEIIGGLSLGNDTDIVRMACSNDARFLIVACSDGTLICLSVTYYLGVGESEERAVRFQRRWEMNATNASVTPSRRSHHIDHDGLYRPDGSDFLERRRSQEDVMSSNESVVVDDGPIDDDNDNDTKGTTGEIHFPTLEFFTGTDKKYNFLAVAEDCGRELSHVLWMDAASSSSDIPPFEASSLGPPPWNVWPFHNPDLVNVGKGDIADSIPHRITCAAVFPCSSDNGAAQEPDTIFAVGTNKGCLGMVSASARGAAEVILLDHPLMQPCQADDDRGLPHWKITHLHWLESRTLAVGLSRVIANTDSKKEEGGEDDSNEHQASFLMGTVIAEGDGDLDPRNSSSWSWSVLGDVVPFVSVPKGGHYSFHIALLPGNRTPTASTALVLVGCNVANEVAVLSRRGNNEWAKLDLLEGNHLACPTDEKDEYKFLMGLTVVLLPLRLAGVNDNGNDLCYPFFMLTATDGSLLGFAPFHRTLGERFFARPWNAVETAAVENTFNRLAEMSDKVEASKLDVRPPTTTPAAVSSQREQTSEERANSQSRDGCCLSGLDLGLQSAIEKKPVMETPDEDEADSDPDACRFDYAEASSSARRLSNEQVQVSSAAEKENNDAPSSHQRAYRSGTSALPMNLEAPAFSLRGCSTINPIQTKTTDIVAPRTSSGGFTSGSTGDATFRSPLALEGGIRKSSTNPSFPIQQQHAASATLSLPVFGSGTVESRGGCEILKPSTGSSLSGMGSTSDSKLSVFGSDADSSAGVETVSKKASRNAEKKAEKEGEKVSTRHIDRDSSIKSPIFEFKSTEVGLASFVHPPSPENNISPQPDAFNSFRNKYDSSNPVLAPGSLKPLFDVKNNENEDPPVESSENHIDREEGREQEKDVSSYVDDNSKNINKLIKTPAGSQALKAFNAVVSHMGETDVILPSTKFEAVVEALGEGFHEEELEKQLSLLDPMKSGRIERDAFVKWYCKLFDQKVESSQNSDVAEKKAKAEEAFSNICDNSGDTINASDFAKLLESMGIKYCEEKHRRTIKKISEEDSSSGEKLIKKRVFVRWYVDWLFGDGDSDEKSEAGSGASDAASLNKEFKETSDGWGSLYKTSEKGFWRCKVCMVTNGPSVVKCSSCETMKLSAGPNLSSDNASASATEPKPLSSCDSIGAGGFSFGGSSKRSSIDTGEFTFGGSNPLLSNSILETQKPSSISEPEAGAVPSSNTGGLNFSLATDKEAKSGFESTFTSKKDNTETTEKSSSTSSSSSSNYPSMSSAAPKPIGTSPTKNDKAKSKTSSAAYPPQNGCRENSTSTANKHEPDDILDGQRTINLPIHNPYASSRKRNIHQIMKKTLSNSIDLPTSTTSSATAISTVASGTTTAPVAKRVFNPYAKANSAASSGSIVRNPYSSSVSSTALGNKTPDGKSSNTTANGSNTSSQFSNKEESGSNSERKSNISVKTQTNDDCKKVNPFGQRGISLSLPLAERLPSRNVSFRSAEILTVGELYRYLYDPKNGDTGRQNQITSVRITGTLLCVSMPPVTDDSDASGSALYDKGRFLIVGDPLERIQNPVTSAASASLQESSENDAFQQDRKNTPLVTPSTKSKLKTMPSSILRNKKTPTQKPTIAVFATPKPKHVTTLGGRKSTPRGLLSTGAKKKFVYAGNTKKSPSSLLGGGGLSKKFSTPTSMKLKESGAIRNDSQLDIKRENPTMRSLQQRSLLRLGAVAAGASRSKDRNPKPEQVIQRHASPMVPIWIGSTFDGDGLDGSVVGDLVLIMGEIVNDKCLCCDLDSSIEHTRGSSSDQGDDKKLIEGDNNTIEVKGIKDAAKCIAHRAASISPKSQGLKKRCCECTQFVCARFVKNANGTDMNLLKESLEVRRQYIANRKRQIEMFLPSVENLYSVGLGITTTND